MKSKDNVYLVMTNDEKHSKYYWRLVAGITGLENAIECAIRHWSFYKEEVRGMKIVPNIPEELEAENADKK